ncbi:FG-GAP repeat domain-containing protein [Streptomyces sp. NPDC005167]
MPHKSGGAAGKLRFDAQIEFGAYPDGTVQLAAGDFDNDGADDVVVGSSASTFVHQGPSTGPTLQTEVGTGTRARSRGRLRPRRARRPGRRLRLRPSST